ncbi:MAG: NAD(P)H-dependent FMN reductase [Marinoscillum sp.]|jgi:chromate reductase
MITIVCSTNRNESLSYQISLQYQELLKSLNTESQILNLNELPADFAFSALYENSGKNSAFNSYRAQMKEALKYVFIVPEYNGSFPGVLKTFIDGLEYPGTFKNKKCALVGLSSGVQGGGLALSHLTDIFNYCGMNVLALKPKLALIEKHIDENSQITNMLYKSLLQEQAELLLDF